METLLQFLETYEKWIYVILGAVGLINFYKTVQAWREWRSSTYGLERENAQRRFSSSITLVILLGLLGVTEMVLVSFISPGFPFKALQTPTVSLLITPTVTLESNAASAATPTINPEALPTLQIASSMNGCIPGQIEWISPKNGDEVNGTVILKGTVNVPNFDYYKYEFSQPGSDTWTAIASDHKKVVNDQLGVWYTNQLAQGDYLLRLVVTDNEKTAMTPCGINVRVVSP